MKKLAIGVDVGTTKVSAGIVEFDIDKSDQVTNYKIIGLKKTIIHKDGEKLVESVIGNSEKIAKRIAEIITELMDKTKRDLNDIDWIGIGLPGPVDTDKKELIKAPGLKLNDNNNLCRKLERILGKNIYPDNDVNCSTLAELYFGDISKKFNDFVCVMVGTGIGSGVIVNKKLVRGCHFSTGEIGHMKIDLSENAGQCTCGAYGCFEEYASARAVIRMARLAMFDVIDRNTTSSPLYKLLMKQDTSVSFKDVTPEDIADILKNPEYENEETCGKLADKISKYLAIGLANVSNITGTESIVIGGGIVEGFFRNDDGEPNARFNKLESIYKDNIFPKGRKCPLNFISFPNTSEYGNAAPVVGAALLGTLKSNIVEENYIAIEKKTSIETIPTISININNTNKTGDNTMGDKINQQGNDNILINRSTVQNAFNKIKNEGNEEVAKALLRIEEEINKSGNKEAAENFESFNEELSKPTPKKSSLKALWNGTLEALPKLEEMVDVVGKIATLFV